MIGKKVIVKILDASETALTYGESGIVKNIVGNFYFVENDKETRSGWYTKSELETIADVV